jgi:hypothetical protein
MDVSLNKSFETKRTAIINCSTEDKKPKFPELNQMIATTKKTFHRWNIQLIDKKQEIIISKYEIKDKLKENTYSELMEKNKEH